jgi:hypothetical protein
MSQGTPCEATALLQTKAAVDPSGVVCTRLLPRTPAHVRTQEQITPISAGQHAQGNCVVEAKDSYTSLSSILVMK